MIPPTDKSGGSLSRMLEIPEGSLVYFIWISRNSSLAFQAAYESRNPRSSMSTRMSRIAKSRIDTPCPLNSASAITRASASATLSDTEISTQCIPHCCPFSSPSVARKPPPLGVERNQRPLTNVNTHSILRLARRVIIH